MSIDVHCYYKTSFLVPPSFFTFTVPKWLFLELIMRQASVFLTLYHALIIDVHVGRQSPHSEGDHSGFLGHLYPSVVHDPPSQLEACQTACWPRSTPGRCGRTANRTRRDGQACYSKGNWLLVMLQYRQNVKLSVFDCNRQQS